MFLLAVSGFFIWVFQGPKLAVFGRIDDASSVIEKLVFGGQTGLLSEAGFRPEIDLNAVGEA